MREVHVVLRTALSVSWQNHRPVVTFTEAEGTEIRV